MTDHTKFTNALIDESSPYLLQHAHNPVAWNAWNDNVWEQAKDQNKLVIVSIGYSTCHWCHVMEHECFEDVPTADLMNASYISIKVDREERPDIDMIYMDACQLITGRGGWPLNVICLPDKRPVYAGTYFPKENWQSLLRQLEQIWKEQPEKLIVQAATIEQGINRINLQDFVPKAGFNRKDLAAISEKFAAEFDLEHGGLKRSQKFPMPSITEYLLDEYLVSGQKDLLDFANFTLIKMSNGGIYDHLRGGFYRYTVDPYWFAPHFEKMLYDNAQLISLYSHAFAITKAEIYSKVVVESIVFLQREMKMPNGGYYAALDADSEGIEGRFYVFTWQELKEILPEELLQLAALVYDLKEKGNWEHQFNILSKSGSPLQLLEKSGLDIHSFNEKLGEIHRLLFAEQESRIRPSLDNKIICAWNGLMLKALADAAKYLQNPQYLSEACHLAEWMTSELAIGNKLKRTLNSKTADAFSEDYANIISGLIALYEADGNVKWLTQALAFTNTLVQEFFDPEKQLFFFTSLKAETLILRKTDITDDVMPSANAIMALNLQKLGVLCNRNDLSLLATEMFKNLRSQVYDAPVWHSVWAKYAQAEAIGWVQVVGTGVLGKANIQAIQAQLPTWAITAYHSNSNAAVVQEKASTKNAIYICLDKTCFEPVQSAEEASQILMDILSGEPN